MAILLTLSRVMGSRIAGRPKRAPPPAVAAVALLAGLIGVSTQAKAEDTLQLEFRQHRFVPNRITVPANAKFRLMVKNNDDTADEFESVDLNREKLVPPGQTITVFLGPLTPGEYKFFGDFHQDTAQGVMVAK
jgi:heme/copper-type cytochrome/quinol oxidase subunit 2